MPKTFNAKPRWFLTEDYTDFSDFLYPWHPCNPWLTPPSVAALPRGALALNPA